MGNSTVLGEKISEQRKLQQHIGKLKDLETGKNTTQGGGGRMRLKLTIKHFGGGKVGGGKNERGKWRTRRRDQEN